MPRPHRHLRSAAKAGKSFWDSGFGTTLIFFAICLACVPIYIGIDALGGFSLTGLAVIFVGFWTMVLIAGWLVAVSQRRRALSGTNSPDGSDASPKT